MRKAVVLLLVLCLAIACAGCGHTHTWVEATCTEPKTCSECGATEGEALGHTWVDATCTEPKTCSVCGETEGEALGHSWNDATCTEPKTCSVCGETEGEPLSHTWVEATCTEPKTCSVCGATEGEALGHSWNDATCTEPKTCSVCGETEGEALGHSPSEAEYWQGSVCTVCGEVLSEPLQADFEKYGLDVYTHDVGLDEVYTYTTSGYGNETVLPEYDAVAEVRSYGIILVNDEGEPQMDHWTALGDQQFCLPADEALVKTLHEVEELAGEGYEWRAVYFKIMFTDRPHGYSIAGCEENYYDIVAHDELSEDFDMEEESCSLRTYPVAWKDGEKTVYQINYFRDNSYGNGWYDYEVYYYVPVGYDGCVFGVYDQALTPNGWEDGKYIFDYMNENMVLFRLR